MTSVVRLQEAALPWGFLFRSPRAECCRLEAIGEFGDCVMRLSKFEATSPYRVRLVRTTEQFDAVLRVREKGYAHLSGKAGDFRRLDEGDEDRTATLILAEDGTTGEPLGTARVHVGHEYLSSYLPELKLPAEFFALRVSYTSRLTVCGREPAEQEFVTSLIVKSLYQIYVASQVSRAIILIRPSTKGYFSRLGFDSIVGKDSVIDLSAKGYDPLLACSQKVAKFDEHLMRRVPALYNFVFGTFHPEIEVFQSITSRPSRQNQFRVPIFNSSVGEKRVA